MGFKTLGGDVKHQSHTLALTTFSIFLFFFFLEVYFPTEQLFPWLFYLLIHFIHLQLKASLAWPELKDEI